MDNLTVDDGGCWRMPTNLELKRLYEEGKGDRNMDPIFKTTGWWVWSGEIYDSSSAWYVDFYHGYGNYHNRGHSYRNRGFAVRSVR